MAQINNYQNRSAYEADQTRDRNISSVSRIQDEKKISYDGVNVTVEKASAEIGDLVVYDKSTRRIRFVKASTLNAALLPDTFVPAAVVFHREGDIVYIVSLSQGYERWACPFEAKITNVATSAAGKLEISVTTTSSPTTEIAVAEWAGETTLTALVESLNTSFKAMGDTNKRWRASVSDDGTSIICSFNWWTGSKVTAVSGGTLAVHDDVNYQLTYAFEKSVTYIRRANGYTSYNAGAHLKRCAVYYGTEGDTPTQEIPLGSGTTVNRNAFETSEHCAKLREVYATYEDYLLGEKFAEFPSTYGPMRHEGKEKTAFLASQKGTLVRGPEHPRYPAADAANRFGISVDGHVTGLEPGNWWLPSTEEMFLLIRDRRYNSADDIPDPVNDTLVKMRGTGIYAYGWYPWTCCEYNSNGAFLFYGYYGTLDSDRKYNSYRVREVSAL